MTRIPPRPYKRRKLVCNSIRRHHRNTRVPMPADQLLRRLDADLSTIGSLRYAYLIGFGELVEFFRPACAEDEDVAFSERDVFVLGDFEQVVQCDGVAVECGVRYVVFGGVGFPV